MHVHPISTFRLFQEGHLLRNSIAIFALTTLFYFIGAELRLVHELSLFWPLNGVMAGVFARYVWLNRLHYYALLSGRLVRSVLIVWISGLCLPTGSVSNSQRAC